MLRLALQSDLPILLIIENLTQISPWSLDIFEQCIKAGYVTWVIEKENQVIGFAMISMHELEVHLLNIGIHPDFQRQGFGQSLLNHIITQIKNAGASIIYLEVRRSNLPAITLYDKLGFIQIAVRKNYYPAKQNRAEDALIFALDLTLTP